MSSSKKYIIKIYSEQPLNGVWKGYIKVDIDVKCSEGIERKTRIFSKNEWEEIKKFGYYLG